MGRIPVTVLGDGVGDGRGVGVQRGRAHVPGVVGPVRAGGDSEAERGRQVVRTLVID